MKSAWTRYAQGHMIQRARPRPGRTMCRLCRGCWLAHARTHATRHTSTFAPFFFFNVVNLQQPGGKGPTALLAEFDVFSPRQSGQKFDVAAWNSTCAHQDGPRCQAPSALSLKISPEHHLCLSVYVCRSSTDPVKS